MGDQISPLYMPMSEASGMQESGLIVRWGVIDDVNSEAATCTVKFLDHNGGRTNVVIPSVFSAPGMGIYAMAVKGTQVLGLFKSSGEFTILATTAFDYPKTLAKFNHRPMQPGEIWIKAAGGGEVDMAADGSITARDAAADEITLNPNEGSVLVKSANSLTAQIGNSVVRVAKNTPDAATQANPVALAAFIAQATASGPGETVEIDTGRPYQTTGGGSVSPVRILAGDLDGAVAGTTEARVEVHVKKSATDTESLVKMTGDGNIEASGKKVVLKGSGSVEMNPGASSTPGVARKGDATLIDSTTDVNFTKWMAAVDVFIKACQAVVGPPTASLVGVAAGVYTATAVTSPSRVKGKINAASSTVKAGD